MSKAVKQGASDCSKLSSNSQDTDSDDEDGDEKSHQKSLYECLVAEKRARNKARLKSLGFPDSPNKKKPKKKKKKKTPSKPRRSGPLRQNPVRASRAQLNNYCNDDPKASTSGAEEATVFTEKIVVGRQGQELLEGGACDSSSKGTKDNIGRIGEVHQGQELLEGGACDSSSKGTKDNKASSKEAVSKEMKNAFLSKMAGKSSDAQKLSQASEMTAAAKAPIASKKRKKKKQ